MSGWVGAQSLHHSGGKAVVYKGMTDCFTQTVKEEGCSALFKVPLFSSECRQFD